MISSRDLEAWRNSLAQLESHLELGLLNIERRLLLPIPEIDPVGGDFAEQDRGAKEQGIAGENSWGHF